jgi:outer membrane protein assembly factor BamB
MIRIRAGAAWRHDPSLRAALRRGVGPDRLAAARGVVDALALEVDGVDIAAGLAEGPLLPVLEALLRAVARVVAGASHATVTFPDGEVELLIRRRARMALLSVVSLSRPARVLARDVEVEVDSLAAAALDASASLCGELALLLPGSEGREARPLRAAARALRRTEQGAARRPRLPTRARAPRAVPASAPVSCVVELADDEGLLGAYEGGRPDLGSLLGPGRLRLLAAGQVLCDLAGAPFLSARDLGAAADALLAAVRARDPRAVLPLARPRAGAQVALEVDLAAGTVAGPGGTVACPPLALARAFAEAQLELGRAARARNPRQAENAHLAELERGAAARLAQIAELAEGDRAGTGGAARLPAPARLPQRPLGPGRLRRLAFRETFRVEVGSPAGDGLVRAGAAVVIAGAAQVAAVDDRTGEVRWRAGGCAFAARAGGQLVTAAGGSLQARSPRTGRVTWSRPLPGMTPAAATALAHGPLVIVERDALTGLDPGSGRTLWRFEPPGASRVHAAAFGGVLVAGTDAGILYGLDAAGRLVWRLAAPGPLLRPAVAAAGRCLALASRDSGAALLAVDPATGERRWEAALDVPGGVVLAWGRRVAVAGAVGGDPIVTALDRDGAAAWSVAPPLAGPVGAAAAGPLLVVRDAAGALAALGRDGAIRWSRPAPRDARPARAAPPVVVRATVIAAAGEALQAVDARTGELVGAIPAAAPLRLLADGTLAVAALDREGTAAGWRLATHLSVV